MNTFILAFIISSNSFLQPIDTLSIIRSLSLNKTNYFIVCNYYEIQHPNIVYAQSLLESGHFTSKLYKTKNNHLGLYNSSKHTYYSFEHWTDCLRFYKLYIQNRYTDGCYYQFLKELPYATDTSYIQKLKKINIE